MSLNLLLGSSGSGKTRRLCTMMTQEAVRHFERNYLLIVPEQFTLATQRDMIAAAESGGIMNIDVLSFPRLAHRIFEELGYRPPVILEDTGKTMIVKRVALERAGQLGIYAGKVHRQGFISEMKSLIAEFCQYGIGPDELAQMMELAKDRPQLVNKLKDVSVIYEGFRQFTAGRFILNEELLELLTDKAPQSQLLQNACVCFDGFTGFTVMQLRVIECLLRLGCEVHVAITVRPEAADGMPDPENLFYLSQKTIAALEKLAERTGSTVHRECITDPVPLRFRDCTALAALERHIFTNPPKKTHSAGIQLLSCETPLAEVRYLTGELTRLAAEEGCRYGQSAVIVGDSSIYGPMVEREFTAAGIPFFIDSKRNIMGTAPVEMLKAVIEAAATNMSYESVFRFLKTGLTDLSSEDIARLENFCLARAIRGGMWDKEWSGGYKTRYAIDLSAINELRVQVQTLLGTAAHRFSARKMTVRERIGILTEVLEACHVQEKLEAQAEEGRMSADTAVRAAALEAGQLYGLIENVFERIQLLLGEDVISLKEFEEILNTGFSEAKLAALPQESDSVVVGDMERTRLDNVRNLFLIGVNEGMIPAVASEGGILSDADRAIFAEHDIELSPTKRATAYLNEFYLYLNLTKPSDRLYLVSHRMTADKKPGRMSYICSKICRLYDDLETVKYYDGDTAMLPGSDRGRKTAADILRRMRAGEYEPDAGAQTVLYELLVKDPGLYHRLAEAAFYSRCPEHITKDNARKLYGDTLIGSVTRLETYASCAFAHFMNYGLRLEQRAEYKIGSLEIGNIYHKALENYCRELKAEGIAWHDTTEEDRTRHESRAIEQALKDYEDVLADSSRNEYIRTRLSRILSRTISVLDAQVKAGAFEPEYFEKTFRHVGEFMAIEGKIDRMDIAEQDGHRVLRVIDYKSGHKTFDLQQLFYGLQIQLAVYMREGMKELEKTGSKPEFAGMYYYNIDDPIVESDGDDEAVDEAIGRALKLRGPSIDIAAMLGLHDAKLTDEGGELTKSYTSDIIPVAVTKQGKFSSKSKLYTEEQFRKIGDFTERSIADSCSRILGGSVEVNPYETTKQNACTYCACHGVCGFERRLGDRFRTIEKCSEDKIWEKLNGVLSNGE